MGLKEDGAPWGHQSGGRRNQKEVEEEEGSGGFGWVQGQEDSYQTDEGEGGGDWI